MCKDERHILVDRSYTIHTGKLMELILMRCGCCGYGGYVEEFNPTQWRASLVEQMMSLGPEPIWFTCPKGYCGARLRGKLSECSKWRDR